MAFADLVADVDRAVQDHLGGETVSYQPAVGEAVDVVGIFDAQYILVEEGARGAGVEQVTPALFVRRSDLPSEPADGDRITIGGDLYRVREIQPDGMGGLRLLLHRTES